MPKGRQRVKDTVISRPKAKSSNSESNSSRWTNLVPVGSLIVAFMTTMTTMMTQYQNNQLQLHMKELDFRAKTFELTFKPKQDAYIAFMKQLYHVHEVAVAQNNQELPKELNTLETMYFELDPYLEEYRWEDIPEILNEFRAYCTQLVTAGKTEDDERKFQWFRKRFKIGMYNSLFYGN